MAQAEISDTHFCVSPDREVNMKRIVASWATIKKLWLPTWRISGSASNIYKMEMSQERPNVAIVGHICFDSILL